MVARFVSQQHFYLYLLCVSIVAGFDIYNSIVRLKPKNEKQRPESDKSKKNDQKSNSSKDKGTLTLLYIAKFVPNLLAVLIYLLYSNSHHSSLLSSNMSGVLGISTFIVGFLLRQIAIVQLGKFYTYKVNISDDHEMIDTGLYAYMRHPAYTGTFLELTGAALLYNHWILSCFLSLPYLVTVLKRIHQEEKVLIEKFGPKYKEYMQRTGMLLPNLRETMV